MPPTTQIRIRRDTAANFTSANPTLALGEIAYETDTFRFKVGTGSTAWTALGYAAQNPTSLTVASDAFINGARVGIGPAGTDNTVLGVNAGAALQADGTRNVLIGRGCGDSLTTADESVAIGMNALSDATTQQGNVAIGYNAALRTNGASAHLNTAIGHGALQNNVTGGGAVAVGTSALREFVPTGISGNAVAVGGGALQALTTGNSVVAVGRSACGSQTTGSSTVAVGNFALLRNLASDTVGVGADVLLVNTLGTANVAVGRSALGAATTAAATVTISAPGSGGTPGTYSGVQLTYVSGAIAFTYPTADIVVDAGGTVTSVTIVSGGTGFTATSGTVMTAAAASIGNTTGFTCTLATVSTAFSNTAVGHQAGLSLTTASNCTLIGSGAGDAITTGGGSVCVGTTSGGALTTGSQHSLVGFEAGRDLTTSNSSAVLGHRALQVASTLGSSVAAVGAFALQNATSCVRATAIGNEALVNATTATNMVAVGRAAGSLINSGANCTNATNSIFIGVDARPAGNTEVNQVVIGYEGRGDGSNTTVIGNTSTTSTRIPGGNLTLTNGNLILGTAGNGIDFSATANSSGTMTSELLDDYEEGTWTPVLTDGTNNATMNTTNTVGRYIKIGEQVTVFGYVETTALGSVTGNLLISGLPFTSLGTNAAYTGCTCGIANGLSITQYSSVSIRAHPSQAYLVPSVWDLTTGTSQMQASEWTDDGVITFTLTYRA